MKKIIYCILKALLGTVLVFISSIYIFPLFISKAGEELLNLCLFLGIVFTMFICTFILKDK